MKKVCVFAVVLLLFSVSVSAFSLTGFFAGLFSAGAPVITNTQANPIKVYPGQSLNILVAFEDDVGIKEAVAFFPYEGGYDRVGMILSAGNEKKGTYSATWVVHNTENMKWYETEVVLTNVRGGETAVNVKWQDPTQSHPAEQVTPGDFPDGNFSYNGTVTLNAFEGAQEVLLSIQDIDGHNIANLTRYSDGIQLMSAGRILLSSYAVGVGGTNNKFYSTTSTDGDIAIYGYSTATTGDSRGVMGRTDSTTGAAVYGLTSAASGKNYAVYGKVQSSPAGVAGYFEGGLGVRIHSAAYANSSVGNLFGCLSPYNCDNICYNHGLSCYRSLADDISGTARSGWSNSCNQVCNVMGSTNGIYACWCS